MPSRLAAMRKKERDEGYLPDMPDMPDAALHVIAHLFEVGPTLSGGMGAVPLTNQELAAWQSNIGIALAPWQSRFLVGLSREYVAQLHRSEKPNCPAPWPRLEGGANLREVADDMRRSISELVKL